MLIINNSASSYRKAAISAGALFILGDAIISSPPKNADRFSICGYFAAILIGIVLYMAVIPIANFMFSQRKSQAHKIIKTAFLAVLSVITAFVGAKTFILFTGFVGDVVLTQSPYWLINICFGIVVLFFALKEQKASLKFSLICFVFVLFAVVIFFLCSIPQRFAYCPLR